MDKQAFIAKLNELQPVAFKFLQSSVAQKRLVHAYLFVGSACVGKHTLAKWLAQAEFCSDLDEKFQPCLNCNRCLRITQEVHPDILHIKPALLTIKVEQIRSLKKELTKKGLESPRKFVIIQEADKMNTSSQNSLLKLLEEPSLNLRIVLETTNLAKMLPTILSRVQVINFKDDNSRYVSQKLVTANVSIKEVNFFGKLTNDLDAALSLQQDEKFKKKCLLLKKWLNFLLRKEINAFVYVGSTLIPNLEDRSDQKLAFDIINILGHAELKKAIANEDVFLSEWIAKFLGEFFLAQKKWQSNVSFQNVCEQLALALVDGF